VDFGSHDDDLEVRPIIQYRQEEKKNKISGFTWAAKPPMHTQFYEYLGYVQALALTDPKVSYKINAA
jgi:hypothetical protein